MANKKTKYLRRHEEQREFVPVGCPIIDRLPKETVKAFFSSLLVIMINNIKNEDKNE